MSRHLAGTPAIYIIVSFKIPLQSPVTQLLCKVKNRQEYPSNLATGCIACGQPVGGMGRSGRQWPDSRQHYGIEASAAAFTSCFCPLMTTVTEGNGQTDKTDAQTDGTAIANTRASTA